MSELTEHFSLKSHNTFGLDISCRYFFEAGSVRDLQNFFKDELKYREQFMILGEGSNILFTQDYKGTIIHPALKGIDIISEDKEIVLIKAFAGENWDSFVNFCVEKNLSGIENLSLIPGSVGSSPVQNIGAYGVEAKDCIHEVEGFFVATGEQKTFANKDCMFGYRNSIFKEELRNSFLITAVTFALNKNHHFELSYGPVKNEFLKKNIQDLSSLRQTIIEIRESKLPDPTKLGNAGSFFKNPVISNSQYRNLVQLYSEIPSYPAESERIKIPAAWLIEKAGWKGVREGNTGSYNNQPLVIVNYGNATGSEVVNFARKITNSVKAKFNIVLEIEVNII
jgi:UDP-N-acetylmuramate dehydrogenase